MYNILTPKVKCLCHIKDCSKEKVELRPQYSLLSTGLALLMMISSFFQKYFSIQECLLPHGVCLPQLIQTLLQPSRHSNISVVFLICSCLISFYSDVVHLAFKYYNILIFTDFNIDWMIQFHLISNILRFFCRFLKIILYAEVNFVFF